MTMIEIALGVALGKLIYDVSGAVMLLLLKLVGGPAS